MCALLCCANFQEFQDGMATVKGNPDSIHRRKDGVYAATEMQRKCVELHDYRSQITIQCVRWFCDANTKPVSRACIKPTTRAWTCKQPAWWSLISALEVSVARYMTPHFWTRDIASYDVRGVLLQQRWIILQTCVPLLLVPWVYSFMQIPKLRCIALPTCNKRRTRSQPF